jgi:glycosyltransferase involved in cell wall biosynthesis
MARLIPTLDCDHFVIDQGCAHPELQEQWAHEPWTPQKCYPCKKREFHPTIKANRRAIVPLPPRTGQHPILARPIRVGLLCEWFAYGGVEEWFRCLLKFADAARMVFPAIGLKYPEDCAAWLDDVGVDVVQHDNLMNRVDVALCWDTDLSNWADFPGRIVHVAHGLTRWSARWARRHHLFADALVAVSHAAVETFPKESRTHVVTIRNGVDLDRLPAERTPSLEPLIGYIGRWSDEKRPETAACIAKLNNCRCIYLVPTTHQEKASSELEKISVPFELWGIDRLAEFYATVSCMVVASHSEGFGLAIVEAMAAGCPVIATDVGIIPELEREHGLLCVKLSNPPTDDELRESLGKTDPAVVARARQVARKHCDAQTMAGNYADLIENLTTVKGCR